MRELAARSISALAQMVTGANDRLGAPGKRIVFRIYVSCSPQLSNSHMNTVADYLQTVAWILSR